MVSLRVALLLIAGLSVVVALKLRSWKQHAALSASLLLIPSIVMATPLGTAPLSLRPNLFPSLIHSL